MEPVWPLCQHHHNQKGRWDVMSSIKRKVTSLTRTWDNETGNTELRAMVDEVVQRVSLYDPARGRCDVSDTTATVWVDASSVASGVVGEVNGGIVKDA
ncbi:hypothetical protein Pcinc_014867 [Petrolisthes cinctipes]|uniref:Uncharacterized protein n=1 Tax=Petrolisthes cinctipes TaxID=88211 RepID=A0AAE1K5M4_PETCI|nr:hypothetical protein Pcinc_029618 [Petrolisthes cinctipes]KAK3880653.1 hypothetical protein Pcinc_014867 [Petrolisthes cinctipes]